MKNPNRCPIYFMLILMCIGPLHAQHIQWNSEPEKGYVFEISNKEAQKLVSGKSADTIFNGMLHTLIDTFDIKTGWVDRPGQGHFILTRIKRNQLHCEYLSIFPYQVFLFKEYDALALQVLDLDGNVREDAIVRFRFSKLKIDRESKTYRIENDEFYGLKRTVTVELEGFRSVFVIQKHEVPGWNSGYYHDEGPDFYSYLITDKNKYKPGEKVRFKSYALSNSKIPLRKDLEIWISQYRKNIKVGEVSPHRPGSYAGEFQLHDSLNLDLDKRYQIRLREKGGRIVSDGYFMYEDYELTGNKLEIKLDSYQHFSPDDNKLTLTATDINGLMLKDAHANIVIHTLSIQESFQPLLILPDTLYFKEIDLDAASPTEVIIPSELFQKSNTSYRVDVSMTNSENQRLERSLTANYYYSNFELRSEFVQDSIRFLMLKNGNPVNDIPMEIYYDNSPAAKRISLPYTEKLNPALTSYRLSNETISREFLLKYMVPELNLKGGIQKDSFNIELQNPQDLDISWYIYQGSTLLKKGFGKELEYNSLIGDRSQNFYVELLYSFGGQEHSKRSQYIFREDQLEVSLNVPERVYPGQEVDATINVLTPVGKPVKGVDLTALAVTAKLNYHIPDLPYYGPSSSPRPKRDHYSKNDLNRRTAVLPLNFEKWNRIARLDTMPYYQFTYPGKTAFNYSYEIADSTQMSVYVMQNGLAREVYVIELDRRPVYYSWTDQPRKYSFYISPGRKHEISLRLYDRVIVLDSLSVEPGKKTILSVDLENLPRGTKVQKLKQEFSPMEIQRHNSFVARFQGLYQNYSYLESDQDFMPLSDRFRSGYSRSSFIAGPIVQGKKTYVENGGPHTTYRHAGGYAYSFEDNIVYKERDTTLLPKKLSFSVYSPLSNLNDLMVTREEFIDRNTRSAERLPWNPRIIHIEGSGISFRILLPEEEAASGVATLLFENCISGKIVSPCQETGNKAKLYVLPKGCNNLYVIYNNGSYRKMDSILLTSNINVVADLNGNALHPEDEKSKSFLDEQGWWTQSCYPQYSTTGSYAGGPYKVQNIIGNVSGTVYDEYNEPLPGVNIIVKGSNQGTITDLDGRFSLDISDFSTTLVFSFVGFRQEEVTVSPGYEVMVTLTEDILALSEVVVIGYGVSRKSYLTGAVSSISEDYLASIAPDELEPDTSADEEAERREAEDKLYQELLSLNSLRNNFSDVGFWEPKLFTDREGEAHFSIKFPDDITRWDAVVYAMNRNLQTGTARKSIRSYKPLMAELHVPRFLTLGDSAYFIGKVLNYTSDSTIKGQIQWRGGLEDKEKDVLIGGYLTEKQLFTARSLDSIQGSFTFLRDDGYLDGEERKVPVVEQGTIRSEGTLAILQNKDTLQVKASETESKTVEILDNPLDIYLQEVRYLLNYKYACNEQLASKLIGLINHKLVMEYEGKKFRYDKDVNTIIKRLIKNQNEEFLWSWWGVSTSTSYWMSAHILRALKCARDAGYKVDLNTSNISSKAKYQYEFLKKFTLQDVDILHALSDWDAELDYRKYIRKMDTLILNLERYIDADGYHYSHFSYLREKFMLQEIRQKQGLDFEPDSLLRYKKEGIMGEIYFEDGRSDRYWYRDRLSANVIAYRIIKNDSLLRDMMIPMQMYFLSTRRRAQWNTYQSSSILMNVLPDLMREGFSKDQPAKVSLTGKVNTSITDFPYHIELEPNEMLNVCKESGLPLYFMEYTRERVTEAHTGVEGFRIQTYFSNRSTILQAGEPVKLIVEIAVDKDASFEHVMIEVPVPGACSYESKPQSRAAGEIHREYFKESTVIFCEKMATGKYRYEIPLLPRFTGKYFVNPAQVSLMYIPVVNANTNMKKVIVEDTANTR